MTPRLPAVLLAIAAGVWSATPGAAMARSPRPSGLTLLAARVGPRHALRLLGLTAGVKLVLLTVRPDGTRREVRLPLTLDPTAATTGSLSCAARLCLAAIEQSGGALSHPTITVLSHRGADSPWSIAVRIAPRGVATWAVALALAPSGRWACMLSTSTPALGLMAKTVWVSADGFRRWRVEASDWVRPQGARGLPAAGYPTALVATPRGAWMALSQRGLGAYLAYAPEPHGRWRTVTLPEVAGAITAVPPAIGPRGLTAALLEQFPSGRAEAAAYAYDRETARWRRGPVAWVPGAGHMGVLVAGSSWALPDGPWSGGVLLLLRGPLRWRFVPAPTGAAKMDWAVSGPQGSLWYIGLSGPASTPALGHLWWRPSGGTHWLGVS